MATPIPSVQAPQTPPRTRVRFSARAPLDEGLQAGLSPSAASTASTSDSGVEDLFDSPLKPKAGTARGLLSPKSVYALEVKDVEEKEGEGQCQDALNESTPSLAEVETSQKLMAENPFDSEHSKILFDAIDHLQSWGSSKYLKIPQLIIVGGQSTGKSSLLQSLTNIPFPVGKGCVTRFPTRIVSRRTGPETVDCFRISIEPAEVRVRGLQPAAPEKIKQCRYKGETLSMDNFVRVMDEVSSEYLCIRKGEGRDKKNFAAEVLRIELSGPTRPHFSILDLPGIIQSPVDVNKSDVAGVKSMIVEYMKNPENIVICVCDAADLSTHEIFGMALEHVDKHRLVGVRTKCDTAERDPHLAEEIVSIASRQTGRYSMKGGWFLVRNTTYLDPETFDLQGAEDDLFGKAPWSSLSRNRLGSAALKTHLADLLSAKIRTAFPEIQKDILRQLNEKLAERASLGEPRDTHSARQNYLLSVVRQYEAMAKTSLDHPGRHSERTERPAMELRREISRLNEEFETFMRKKGAVWAFQENSSIDPELQLKKLIGAAHNEPGSEDDTKNVANYLDRAFPDCSTMGDWESMKQMIKKQLKSFQGVHPAGVVNPDIYPVMYRLQVEKWTKITSHHLRRVRAAVERCFRAILASTCPPDHGTAQLHRRLAQILTLKFETAFYQVEKSCLDECKRETGCQMLSPSDPTAEKQIKSWQQLRFWRGFIEVKGWPESFEAMRTTYERMHSTVQENMVDDIHDIVMVYYGLNVEAFIRNVKNKYTEEFITNPTGPIHGLNTDFVLNMTSDQVESLASEDETTVRRREELKVEIEELEGAHGIAERASDSTSILETE